MKNVSKYFLSSKAVLISTCLFISACIALFAYKHIWLPYWCEYVIGHSYTMPTVNSIFVVAKEPKHETIPPFLQNIISKAFQEYHVVFDNNNPHPDLIVRGECHGAARKQTLKEDIPYIALSGEPKGVRKDQYRLYGLPFAEIVSFKPKHQHQIYAPFMAWSNIELKAPSDRSAVSNRKFLVYVSENCVKQRQKFFALAKATNLGAEALGKCSNTNAGILAPGGYSDLQAIYQQYNFVMAMENSQKPGYITEKIVNAYNSGAIPVYWGDSATVKKIFNPKSFIDLNDFASMQQAIDYIVEVHNNPELIAQIKSETIINSPTSEFLHGYNSDPNNTLIVEQSMQLRTLYDRYMKKFIS